MTQIFKQAKIPLFEFFIDTHMEIKQFHRIFLSVLIIIEIDLNIIILVFFVKEDFWEIIIYQMK